MLCPAGTERSTDRDSLARNAEIVCRYTKLLVTALAMTLFAVVGAANPAQAAEFSVCSTGFGSGCTTRSVQAEGGNVWIGLYTPAVGACSFTGDRRQQRDRR